MNACEVSHKQKQMAGCHTQLPEPQSPPHRNYTICTRFGKRTTKMEITHRLCVFFPLLLSVNGLMWNLQPNTQKCLREELQKNVPVIGDFEVSEAPGQKVDYVVRDSKGHILAQREDVGKGKFSFVTEDYDIFEICFISRVPVNMRGFAQEVSLSTKHGVEAKNYEGIAEAAKLKPLEVELRRLEDLSHSIVLDFTYMRRREKEMTDTNESTNNRVLYFSIFSLFCLLGLATWQVLYLRRYFKAKKLVE